MNIIQDLPAIAPLIAWLGLLGAALLTLLLLFFWQSARQKSHQNQQDIARLQQEHAQLSAQLAQQTQSLNNTQALAEARGRELAANQATLAALGQRLESLLQEQKNERQIAQNSIDRLTQNAQQAAAEHAELHERLIQERQAASEKLSLLNEAKTQLQHAFQALTAEALRANNESFLKLAQENLQRFQAGAAHDLHQRQEAIVQLTQPIRERLDLFDTKLASLEQSRTGAYSALTQQMHDLMQIHLPQLHRETADLVRALRQPQTRGRWGEVQLKRVVELAGMLAHCDFDEQVSTRDAANRLRPDMIVHLPGGRRVIIDAKAPLNAYLTAMEATSDDARAAALQDHARQVRNHITQLSKKEYFDQFDPTPEFVVLFVPGEVFFSAALMQDPELIEYGAQMRVIPASPTTLIALLKAVAYGWRQEALAKNAQEMAELGRELYERMGHLAAHWQKVGKHLDQAVGAFNQSVGTLEGRVLPSARKFQTLGAVRSDREAMPDLTPLTTETRPLTALELTTPLNTDEAANSTPNESV